MVIVTISPYTEMIEGLCLAHRFCNDFGSKRVEKAKIGLIQFQISPPKTDMDNQVRLVCPK